MCLYIILYNMHFCFLYIAYYIVEYVRIMHECLYMFV